MATAPIRTAFTLEPRCHLGLCAEEAIEVDPRVTSHVEVSLEAQAEASLALGFREIWRSTYGTITETVAAPIRSR